MSERDAIIETITRLFWHTDHHEWDAVKAVFADEVLLDYTSLQGGEPATQTPHEIVGGWSEFFATVPAHQHLVSNHLVEIEEGQASVTAQFIATHQWEDRSWTLGGDYAFRLRQQGDAWLVEAMTMHAVWQDPGAIPAPPA